jgi:hypothetical protein
MKCIKYVLLAIGLALPPAGWVVEARGYDAEGGYCYWHPYRCR